jgi:hypothetical protein
MLDCLANIFHPEVVRRTSFPVSPMATLEYAPEAFKVAKGGGGDGTYSHLFAR